MTGSYDRETGMEEKPLYCRNNRMKSSIKYQIRFERKLLKATAEIAGVLHNGEQDFLQCDFKLFLYRYMALLATMKGMICEPLVSTLSSEHVQSWQLASAMSRTFSF